LPLTASRRQPFSEPSAGHLVKQRVTTTVQVRNLSRASLWGLWLAFVLLAGALAAPSHAAFLTAADGKRVFVRGVGYSPYHPTQGWDLTSAMQNLDRQLLRGLGANAIMLWRPLSVADAAAWYQAGLYTIPQVDYVPAVQSIFPNGQDAPVPVYLDATNHTGLREAAKAMGARLKDSPGVLAVSLGNDYAWSAFSGDLGFAYAGSDDATLGAFRTWLWQRLGSEERFAELMGRSAGRPQDAVPPVGLTPAPLYWEWWQFMRQGFSDYLKEGWTGIHDGGCARPVTYAAPRSVRWDPATEGAGLPYLELVSGNLFHEQGRDFGAFCASLDRMICEANGRPVLISETGAHTLGEAAQTAPQTIKQSLACALLHPEVAGVCLYEFCDNWQRAGKPNQQEDSDPREYWGLVSAQRAPKPTYTVAASMFALMKRQETLLQEWQSPPEVILSEQDLDWWRLGGNEANYFETVAAELYRMGISFRLAGPEALKRLDPQKQPRLILCDSVLAGTPERPTEGLQAVANYLAAGGQVLYLSRIPWRCAYAVGQAPPELAVGTDKNVQVRGYGKGLCTIVPAYDTDRAALRYHLTGFLADVLAQRPISLTAPEGTDVFWRVFTHPSGRWLWVVNAGPGPVREVTMRLSGGLPRKQVILKESDGARLSWRRTGAALTGLQTYALIKLGP
jgi:hypothetical protein